MGLVFRTVCQQCPGYAGRLRPLQLPIRWGSANAEPQRIAAEAWQAEEFWKAQPDMNTQVRFNIETGDVISVKPAPFYANNPAVIAALHGACAMVVTVT